MLDDRIPTFATDAGWRIYLNPAHADRLSVEAYAAELIHEVNHLIRSSWNVCTESHIELRARKPARQPSNCPAEAISP